MKSTEIIDKIVENIQDEPLTVHQLCLRIKMDARTIHKYLEIIGKIQSGKRVVLERSGLRVFVSKK